MKKKDIDLIEKLNRENWIEENLGLVKFIDRKPRIANDIHKAKKFGSGLSLTKKLNRGVDFGVFNQTTRFRGKYSLTARSEKYLDEQHGDPKLDERQGDHKEAARAGTD